MVPLRFIVGATSLCLVAVLSLPAGGADAPAAGAAARQDSFHYPLRAGESLTDVARIFRVPLTEIVELNHIGDPNRLSAGQVLRIPNAFALQAGAYRAERDRLLQQSRALERQTAAREATAAQLAERVRVLEAEKESLAADLAATSHWQLAAKTLLVALLAALGWALKARAERAVLLRKLNLIAAENATLMTAKETYRSAAAQLELRYQKLYRGKGETPRDVIADGTARLARAFNDGVAQVERLVSRIEEERGNDERGRDAEQRVLARVLHPLRELRYRLKFHTP